MSKYNYNKDYFSIIDTEDKAYWLGFLYADGCINRYYKNEKLKSMSLELNLCEKDKEHLNKFLKCLNSNVPIQEKTNNVGGKQYKSYRLTINCTKLCYDLIDLGCTPQKTYTIKFPTDDIVPKNLMKDFLRGFFDGDGCISVTRMNDKPHIVTNFSGMSGMLKSISDFLISEKILRVIPKIHKDERREETYNMYFYGSDSNKEFLDYLYKDATIYLDRKYNTYIVFYSDYNEKEGKHGVHYSKRNKAYIVTISINGIRKRVGQYKTVEEAIEARKEAEIEKMNILNSPLNQ